MNTATRKFLTRQAIVTNLFAKVIETQTAMEAQPCADTVDAYLLAKQRWQDAS